MPSSSRVRVPRYLSCYLYPSHPNRKPIGCFGASSSCSYSPECVEGVFSEVRLNGFSDATTVFSYPPCGERDIVDTRRRTVSPSIRTPSGVFSCCPQGPFLKTAKTAASFTEVPRSSVLRTSP